MICLGIESAGKTASIAIMQDNTLLYEATLRAGFTHSESLLQMIDTALSAVRLTAAQIDLWAVCAGPGSFTGLRIGMALVKGLALATGAPCVAVSTLEAQAWTVAGVETVISALDARRGQVYAGGFSVATAENPPMQLFADGAYPVEKLEDFVLSCKKPLVFVGDGAEICYNVYGTIPGVVRWPGFLSESRAVGVCLSAIKQASTGNTQTGEQLQPCYHRLSQAERERMERLHNQQEK